MASTSHTPTAEGARWDARLWALLILLCGVLFLDGLDVSMVGVALPSIERDLDLTTSQLQWIVSGYVLGYGGLLLLGGRAADLFGRRRVLLIALTVFLAASALGALVDDPALLIATRFLKGAAAAFTAPAGLSIITTTFAEGPIRNKALSIYTACGASGFSMGLIMGGLLTTIGWRSTFVLPVPIALALLAAAPRVIPRESGDATSGRRHLDLPGAFTVTAGMLVLVRAVVQAPDVGWTSADTLVSVLLAVGLLAAFVAIEQRVAHPLVRLGILRNRSLVRANLGAAAVFGGYIGFQFVGTLYLQTTLGWSALETALAFLPGGLLVAFGAPRVGVLVDRFGTQPVIAVGAAAFAVGYVLFLRLDATPVYATLILPTMLLIGIGFALCFPSLNMQATNGVADDEQGLASGLVNTSFQVGGAFGLAIVSAVVSSGGAGIDAYRPAIGVVAGVAILGLLVALSGVGLGRRAQLALGRG